jgi:WD40 repeat protein/serine/threonine protein kinase
MDDAATLERIDEAADRFESAWRGGERPSIEDLVAAAPPSDRDRLLPELVLVEWGLRLSSGEVPRASDYEARFPSLDGAALRRLLAEAPLEPEPGARGPRIGPYRLLGELGRGGMGAVYLAEQTEPVQRRVALKTSQHDDPELLARFRLESQALAAMEHPHVAKVFDAGTSEEGVAYIAMELVPGGVPITVHCESHGLLPRERVALMVPVCEAVHHAHQKGLLHRDLKPGNVLVSSGAGPQVPKVIDFGLAKAVRPDAGRGVHTEAYQILGTLAYMSPEQARLNPVQVDAATDVYGLGAVLYELLVGSPPFAFDRAPLREADLVERLRVLRQEEPERPSARVLGAETPPRTKPTEGWTRQRWSAALRGDLDWIVLKAIEKDPARRYASADALAQDLRRFLANEPVEAAPVSTAYRLRKWVRRRPARAVAVGVGLVAPIVAAGALLLHTRTLEGKNVEIARSAREAREERDAARTARERSLALKREADRFAYAAAIGGAQDAWHRGQPDVAVDLLDSVLPEPFEGGRLDLRGWEWRYLRRLCGSERVALVGHTSGVTCFAYDATGERIVSGSRDRTARLWDARTGATLRVLVGHLDAVDCVAFSTDGTRVATGTREGTVRLWDAATGKELAVTPAHLLGVKALAFDPVGRFLATAGADACVQILDPTTLARLRTLPGHAGDVRRLAFHPEGRWLATAGHDGGGGATRVWDVATFSPVRVLEGGTACLAFTPGGRLVLGARGRLSVVDVETGEVTRTLGPETAVATDSLVDRTSTALGALQEQHLVPSSGGFAYAMTSPDGKAAVTVDMGWAQTWDLETGTVLRVLPVRGGAVAWSPDGGEFLMAGPDRCLRVVSATEEPGARLLRGHLVRVTALAYSPDGRRLASGSLEGSVRISDAVTGEWLATLGEHRYTFSRRAGGERGALRSAATVRGHGGEIRDLSFSPDGLWLASVGGNEVCVWDAENGEEALTLPLPALATSVAWAPDGRSLAAGCWDDDVRLFAFPGGEPIATLQGHAANVAAVAFLGGGRILASAGWDETVRLWDVERREAVWTLTGPDLAHLTSLVASSDGRFLATAGDDAVVTVWDAQTREVHRRLLGHVGRIDALAFARDGSRLASVGGRRSDRGVLVWDVASGRDLVQLPGIRAVAFSPDGRFLASPAQHAASDIRVYDAAPVADLAIPPEIPPTAEGDEGVRALGTWSAPRLTRRNFDEELYFEPREKGHVLLVGVVSFLDGLLVPSEEAYEKLVEADRGDGYLTAKRDCILSIDPGRFRLLAQDDGVGVPGIAVSPWPTNPASGFVPDLHVSNSDRVTLAKRSAWAIAWSVDPARLAGPLAVRMDDGSPVPLPSHTLEPDPRLHPPPVPVTTRRRDLVAFAIRRASSGALEEAAAVAAWAVLDPDAEMRDLWRAALLLARASAVARAGAGLPDAERTARAESHAASAVRALRRAMERGFDALDDLDTEEDLDALRGRADFQALRDEVAQALGPR